MLVLSRKKNERIKIADDIYVTVVDVRGDKVRIGIEAPKETKIIRTELEDRPFPDKIIDLAGENLIPDVRTTPEMDVSTGAAQ